jgi:hypothetical protein
MHAAVRATLLLVWSTTVTTVGAPDPGDPAAPSPGDCQCADSDTLETGTDYAGNDIDGERQGIATVQDCCEVCAATPGCVWFQSGTGAAQGLCWTKSSKDGEAGKAPRIGATVSEDFKANKVYCHSVGGWSFLILVGLGAGLYVFGGAAYGVRVLGKPSRLPDAHPHCERWSAVASLVLDGVAVCKAGGFAPRGSGNETLLASSSSGDDRADEEGSARASSSPSASTSRSSRKVKAKQSPRSSREDGAASREDATAAEPAGAGAAPSLDEGKAKPTGRWVHVPE